MWQLHVWLFIGNHRVCSVCQPQTVNLMKRNPQSLNAVMEEPSSVAFHGPSSTVSSWSCSCTASTSWVWFSFSSDSASCFPVSWSTFSSDFGSSRPPSRFSELSKQPESLGSSLDLSLGSSSSFSGSDSSSATWDKNNNNIFVENRHLKVV